MDTASAAERKPRRSSTSCWSAEARGPPARLARLEQLGLNSDTDLERHLGTRVVESASALGER
jgi:hypothetical protein